MSLTPPPVPWQMGDDGVCRVGGTRVRLDTVIAAFNQGSAPEEIQLKYPSLRLTDIYGVVAYYLWNQSEVDVYLRQRAALEERTRFELEQQFPSNGIRERLLSRRKG